MIVAGGITVDAKTFPDHSLLVKFDPYDEKFQWADDISVQWFYENDAELFTLICIKKHLDHFFDCNTHINLYMPYVPHARMDRVKNSEEVFTLKYFCETINSLKFDTVFVLDVHSNVSLALLDNVVEMKPFRAIERAMQNIENPVLFYPDEGAMKRYSKDIVAPYAFGIKDRDWKTGQIKGLTLINADAIKDQNVLIVDDICSRGGTFFHSANALKAAGAKSISLYVTHCENTILDGEVFTCGLIDNVYTSNTLIHCDELANKVKYV